MKPKKKAIELIEKFRGTEISFWEAKSCALICVEEVIRAIDNTFNRGVYNFWTEVQDEIKKL